MGTQRLSSTLLRCLWLLYMPGRAVGQFGFGGGFGGPPNFCFAGNTTSCGSAFPSTICCATGFSCQNVPTVQYSVLCCASGSNCTSIAPISCSSSTYSAPANVGNQSYVLAPYRLESCGSLCCPMGFTCQDNACVLSQNTSNSTTSSSAATGITTSSSSHSTLTTSSSTSQTAEAGAISTSSPAATVYITNDSTSNNAGTIAGAVVGGVAGLAILVGGAIFLLTRKRRQAAGDGSGGGDTNVSEKHPDALTKQEMAEIDSRLGPSEMDSGSVYEMQNGDEVVNPETKAAQESQRRQRLSRMFELGANRRSEVHELP